MWLNALIFISFSLKTYAYNQPKSESNAAEITPFDIAVCPTNDFNFVAPKIAPGNIVVTSNTTLLSNDALALFEGGVNIENENSIIQADSAQIETIKQQISATGNVEYTDEFVKVKSESVEVSQEIKLLQMAQSQYQIKSVNGRGAADLLSISEEQGLLLEDVSFTTCPIESEDWKIQASKISISPDKPYGEAKHTRFYLGKVPIFYLPYFAFPITTERQSGFLFPEFGSSTSTGLEYEQPFYWNIAPNVDATLAPRLMTNRGLQLKTELRYLTKQHQGEVQLEYLPSDNDSSELDKRYFYRFVHQGRISDNWHMSANISGLSDDNYIIDLSSDYYGKSDAYLYRKLGLDYYSENLNASIYLRDFTTLGDVASHYRALPEIKINYESQTNNYLEYEIKSELAYFETRDSTLPNAFRMHIEPSLRLPYRRSWGELLAEVTIMHTRYQQDLKQSNNLSLRENVARTIPQGRLYGSLIFENQSAWQSKQYTLTLEPKVQYLYTDFKEQSNIGLYDTTPLLTTVKTLFRGQEFTGLDRINSNDQITLGVSSRLIDKDNFEQLVVSAGQIFYFDNARLIDNSRNDDRSALATEIDWQVNQNWFLHSDIQLGTRSNKVERSSLATEYRLSNNKIVKLNHRFIRELSGEKIDQIGITASWPLTKNWHWVGRHYRDLDNSRSIESYMGLEYESCCWAIRFTMKRNIATRFNNNGERNENEFDSGVSLEFVFKGMGSSSNKSNMLEEGLFGYRQPFVIN